MRAAAWLVCHYPLPWRARYEDEVLQLLEDSPARWRDVADLTRGLLTERALSLFEPGDHPLGTVVTLMLLPFPVVVMCWVSGAFAGSWLRTAFGPSSVRAGGSPLLGLLLIAGLWLQITWLSRYGRFDLTPSAANLSPPSPQPQWSKKLLRIGVLWFCGVFLDALLIQWGRPEPLFSSHFPLVILLPFGTQIPIHRLHAEIRYGVTRLQELRILMKWARLELTRCESLHASGTSSPLEKARTEVRHLEEQQAEALATLQGMGYRARFQ
jgi:hypothetical protein